MGSKFDLPLELQETLLIHSKEFAPVHKKRMDQWLKFQFKARQEAEQMKLEKKMEGLLEENIVIVYLFEQFHSPRFWKTGAVARKKFKEMRGNKLEAVKEQILIAYLGLGIEGAHHPWSEKQGTTTHTFTADELFEHFVLTVLPLVNELKRKGKLPTKPPLNFPSSPETMTCGTTSELGQDLFKIDEERQQKLISDTYKTIDAREAEGKGDMLSDKQDTVAPEIDNNLVKRKFKIEMMFEQVGNGGELIADWYHGVVVSIVNKKKRTVEIEWNENCLHEDDPKITKHQLLITRYNPKKPQKGAWRQYIKDKRISDI